MDAVAIALSAKERVSDARSRVMGRPTVPALRRRGFVHGKRLHVGPGASIDWDFAWLIEVGDDVTMAPNVSLVSHDASTKMHSGYTRIAPIIIGNRVFLGAGTTVLPGVTIGDDVIVGAGSVVTKDIPSGSLAVGTPAKVVGRTEDYLASREQKRAEVTTYETSPHRTAGFSPAEAARLRATLGSEGAYVP